MSDIEVPPPTLPQFQPGPVMTAAEAIVHALCGAQYGDLEFDVGKSIRWTQWFTDDVFITDVNLGSPRYWIVNWAITYPQAWHAVTGVNYFYSTVAFRKEQWRQAKLEQHIQYDQEDWVLFVDASEGLAIDTRDPQPINADVEPFKSYLYREVQRAETAGKDRVVLPFYAFQRHDNIVTAYYESPAFADGSLGYTRATATMGTPYYVPYQGLTRLIKVKVLDDPAFNWATIDTPSTAATGLNIAIVSYGYAHWNLQDIVPPATTVEPLAEANDDGYRMRNLLSLVRPVTGLPYGTPYHPLAQDTGAIPGPWAATDQFTPDPVVDSGPYLNATVGYAQTPDAADLVITGNVRFTAKVRDDSVESTTTRVVAAKQNTGSSALDWRFGHTYLTGQNMTGYPTGVSTLQVVAAGQTRTALGLTPPGTDRYFGVTLTGLTPPGLQTATLRGQWLTSTDGVTWTNSGALGSAVRGDALSYDGATPLLIGFFMQGRVYWVQMEAINRARLVFPGVASNYLSVPDASLLDITGDVTLVAQAALTNYASGVDQYLVAKYDASGAAQRSYALNLLTSGQLVLRYSMDGLNAITHASTVPVTGVVANGAAKWFAATLDVDNGASGRSIRFWYSDDGSTWTQLGTTITVAGTIALFSGTATCNIGAHSVGSSPPTGRIMRAQVRNCIGAAGVPGSATPQLVFSGAAGNWLTIPHAATGQLPAGDIEIVARVSRPNWSGPAGVVIAKNGAYYFLVGANSVQLWSPGTFPISSALGFADGAIGWVRATRVAATGLTSFYSAADSPTEPTSWTARGTSTGPTGAYPNPSAVVSLGAYNGNGNVLNGRILRVIVRDGIGGSVLTEVNESNVPAVGATTFPATTGGTVTVNQRQQPIFTFPGTTGNYLSVPDAAAFDITTDFTIIVQGTFLTPPAGVGTFLSKRESNTTGSYRWDLMSSGLMRVIVTPNGTDTSQVVIQSNAAITFGTRQWLACTFDADNGASASSARFFTSTDGTTWSPLGTAVTGVVVASLFNSTSRIEIGTTTIGTQNFLAGTLERVILNTGIGAAGVPGGTAVLDVSRDTATVGATSFAATTGGTVTVNQSAATICQVDPAFQFPLIQGIVLDINENNAGVMTDATHFVANTGQTVTVNQTAGQTIVQPQPDSVVWRFDAKDYPGTGLSYVDPRGRTWTLSAAGAIAANAVDNMAQPVTPDPSLAGLLVPLYDNVLRINMRDGVWYEGGELGNIPLAWDDATQTWYPSNMSPQEWHDSQSWVAPVG